MLWNPGFEDSEDFLSGSWTAKVSGEDWEVEVPSLTPEPFGGRGCFRVKGQGVGEMDSWQPVRTIEADPEQPEGRGYEVIVQVFPEEDCSDDVSIRVGFESKIYVDGLVQNGAYQMVELRAADLKKGQWNRVRATAKVGGQILDNLFVKLWILSKDEDAIVDIAFDEVEISEMNQ